LRSPAVSPTLPYADHTRVQPLTPLSFNQPSAHSGTTASGLRRHCWVLIEVHGCKPYPTVCRLHQGTAPDLLSFNQPSALYEGQNGCLSSTKQSMPYAVREQGGQLEIPRFKDQLDCVTILVSHRLFVCRSLKQDPMCMSGSFHTFSTTADGV
jgi:hypothetical protein